MGTESVLKGAIAERVLVSFRYDVDSASRQVAPHAIFRNEAGDLMLSAYQVSGYSSTSNGPVWRDFNLSKIRGAQQLDEIFAIESAFNPSGRKYEHGLVAYVRP